MNIFSSSFFLLKYLLFKKKYKLCVRTFGDTLYLQGHFAGPHRVTRVRVIVVRPELGDNWWIWD